MELCIALGTVEIADSYTRCQRWTLLAVRAYPGSEPSARGLETVWSPLVIISSPSIKRPSDKRVSATDVVCRDFVALKIKLISRIHILKFNFSLLKYL